MARTTKAVITAITFFLLLLPLPGQAKKDDACVPLKEKFYEDKERGWYFNEYCAPPKKKKEKTKDLPHTKKSLIGDLQKLRDPSFMDTLDVKTFRETFEEMKNETIYHSSKENMITYLAMQDFMKKKALTFSRVWQDVLLEYPEFNNTVKSPASNYGSMVKTFIQIRDNEKQLSDINDEAGIFLMVSGACPYCKYQADVVNDLMVRYGLEIRSFSKDYCIPEFSHCTVSPAMFDTFNIKATPSIMAVYREEGDKPRFQLISTGLLTQSEIVEKLVYYHKNRQSGMPPD